MNGQLLHSIGICGNFRYFSFRTATTRTMKTVSRYSGIPPPSNGRSALAFEVGETIEILSDSDPDWLEVCSCYLVLRLDKTW